MNLSNLFRICLWTILFWGTTQYSRGLAQCGLTGKTIIRDEENEMPDTTLLQIVIENAVNNNLSHPLQGLCAVGLRFKHPFVKELVLELISPAGQKITLVGGNISAYFTGFVNWDVKFVQNPPEGTAAPDPGFSEVWENDQDWENFKTYKGDYYPHEGRLQNFNTGPVNGTWTLRCIDFADFGEGEILSFQLFFCDDEGLKCEACLLDPGLYAIPDFTVCTGSQELLINTNKKYLTNPPVPESNQNYSNIIFNNGMIYEYAKTPDLRTSPPGIYTICPLQYAAVESSKLPETGSIHSSESINLLLGNACAMVSDSCLTINVEDNSNIFILDSTICKGDSVVINNQIFKEGGNYIIRIPNGVCDSIVELMLKTIDIQVEITSDRDSLNCFNNTISLVADGSVNSSGTLSYSWAGKNHGVDTDPAAFIVDISKPDIYFVTVSGVFGNLECSVTDSIEIFADNSVPEIGLNADTLTCRSPQTEIIVSSSRIISNTIWESEDLFPITAAGFNAIVDNAGKYKVIVMADNGCSVVDSITVQEDKTVSPPDISSDTLNCTRTESKISITHPDQKNYTYLWTGVNPGTENQKEPIVSSAGMISLLLTDGKNGCTATFESEIIQDIVKPEITLIIADTINCNRTFITPQVQSNIVITAFQWIGPGLNSSLSTPLIQQGGMYNVRITGPNGCVQDSFFTVESDTAKAALTLMADKFTCNRKEVNITLTSSQEVIDYLWSGPDGFSSTDASPIVGQTGTYFVTVTTANNCKSINQITIENDEDIPFVFFEVPPISCAEDTVTILVNTPPGKSFTYNWSGPGVLNSAEENIKVSEPGTYQVTVTDVNTSCTSAFSVNVEDQRIYPVISLQSELLNCMKDSIQIILTSVMPLQSVSYTGPHGFFSTEQSPYIRKEGWYYIEFKNMLECSSKDSILIERNDRFPEISTGIYRIMCQQDSILVKGNSDIEGTQFTWSGPSDFSKKGQEVFVYEGGTYQLSGLAPNECISTITFEIQYDTIRPDLSITTPDVLTCADPVTRVTANSQTNDVSFTWTGPDNFTGKDADLDKPGIYILKATAANQCSDSLTFEVKEDKTFPEFTFSSDTINCIREKVRLMITTSDENTVKWNSSNPIEAGNNVREFETSLSGTYRFSITNTEQCVTDGSIEVQRDVRIPVIQSFSLDSITCDNALVTIAVNISTPVESYIWEGPSIVDNFGEAVIVSDGGNYSLRIMGKNGCIKDTSFFINKNREIPEFTTFTDTLTCEKGKINIGVNPLSDITTYLWNGPDFSSTLRNPVVLVPGIYSVTVTNNNGCSSTAIVTVFDDFKSPEFMIPEIITLPCDGTPLKLKVQSEENLIRYRWTFPDGTSSIESNPLSGGPGIYTIQVVAENGCLSETKSFEATDEKNKPDYTVLSDTLTCIKKTAFLQTQSFLNTLKYQWTGPNQSTFSGNQIEVNEPGVYQLIVSDSILCSDTVLVKLNTDTIVPDFQITQEGAIVCESADVKLKAETIISGRNYNFNWNTTNGIILTSESQQTIRAGKTGTYSVSITDTSNGCQALKSFTIQDASPSLTFLSADVQAPSCAEYQNGSIKIESINGIPPYTIHMNGVNSGQRLNFNFLSSGTYNFTIKDSLGCVLDTILIIQEAIDPVIDLPSEINLLFGDSVLIKAEIFPENPSGWLTEWSVNNNTICENCISIPVMPFVNTIYNFEISVDGKCKNTASVLVKVKNDLNSSVPNVFKPGSSSGNDRFFIPQIRGIEKIISLIVIDKWAEPVFASFEHLPGDPEVGWDGTFNGKDAVPGVYVVIAEMLLTNGQKYRYVGDLTLIR